MGSRCRICRRQSRPNKKRIHRNESVLVWGLAHRNFDPVIVEGNATFLKKQTSKSATSKEKSFVRCLAYLALVKGGKHSRVKLVVALIPLWSGELVFFGSKCSISGSNVRVFFITVRFFLKL